MLQALTPLATVDQVQLLHGPFADEELDKVRALLEAASGAVRRFCRQTLSLVTDDEVVVLSTGTAFLELGERPVLDVAEVEIQSPWWSVSFFTPGEFSWDGSGQLHRLDGLTFGHRYDPVRVVYTHGFDPIPADLSGFVAGKVAASLSSADANPGGLRSLQVGAMSETYSNAAGTMASLGASALSEDERAYLRDAGYRRSVASAAMGAR
jgi:hypothetical protein